MSAEKTGTRARKKSGGKKQPPAAAAKPDERSLAELLTALAADLTRTIDKFGVDAAVTRYHELREQYYGTGAYDFSPIALNEVGRSLGRSGRSAEAIAMLELNAEQYPQDVTTAVALGQLHAQAGEREKAIASFERALQLQPNNRQARQALQRLRGG